MPGLLDHRLLVIAGKGGVGKTTLAAALALTAAGRGRRVIVAELAQQSRVATLLGTRSQTPGTVTRLRDGLDSISIDPDQALLEWLQALGGRVSGRLLAGSGTFQYFAAAAPGAKELVSMVKIAELVRGRRRRGRPGHDLVILDAPATGHALGLLRSPQTFGSIARVGPIVRQTDDVSALLRDPLRTAYVAVATGSEMAVSEVIELEQGLRASLDRSVEVVLANALMPRRFSSAELADIAALDSGTAKRVEAGSVALTSPATRIAPAQVIAAAARAARTVHERWRLEQAQIARLRRRGFEVTSVPFQWVTELDLEALERIASHLARSL